MASHIINNSSTLCSTIVQANNKPITTEIREGNPSVTVEYPSQSASNAEKITTLCMGYALQQFV